MQILPISCLRGVAMATTFWLSMAYNVGCVIASDIIFDRRVGFFGVKLSDEVIADFELLRDVATATIFLAFNMFGAHWRHLQITLTSCYLMMPKSSCSCVLTTVHNLICN